MFTYKRESVDINGTWKFCPDPMQRCRRQKWWQGEPDRDEIFPSWDPQGLWDIQVPGTWKTPVPPLQWYDGHAVYMKDFVVEDLPADREYFLCFDGIVYAAEIYLNGALAARHQWSYSPFQVRVTECIARRNRLFVLVENQLKADRVPGEIFDWNNDGGIINPVKLISVPSVYLDNFRVSTELGAEQARIEVEISLGGRNDVIAQQVSVRIPELGLAGMEVVRPGNGDSEHGAVLAGLGAGGKPRHRQLKRLLHAAIGFSRRPAIPQLRLVDWRGPIQGPASGYVWFPAGEQLY